MYRVWLRQAAHVRHLQSVSRRTFASGSGPPSPQTPKPSTQAKTRLRLDKWVDRSPKFFKPTLCALRDAPASYIVSFLVLHEITAVVPLFGLVAGFHYYNWLPPYFAEGKWVIQGVDKFGRYARKKGWMTAEDERQAETTVKAGKASWYEKGRISKIWNKGEKSGRWLVEFATAWAVVKALLPLRIMVSVWAAPPFARACIVPVSAALGRPLRSLWQRLRGGASNTVV